MSDPRNWKWFGFTSLILATVGLSMGLSDARVACMYIVSVVAFATSGILAALATKKEEGAAGR